MTHGFAQALALSPGAFGAVFLSKASGVMLSFALLLLDAYPLRRLGLGWRRLTVEKLPHFALAGLGMTVALWAVRQGTAVTSYGDYGVGARIAMTAYSFVFYPWKWLWPVGVPDVRTAGRVDPWVPRFLVPLIARARAAGTDRPAQRGRRVSPRGHIPR
jgi:hypothetical protein